MQLKIADKEKVIKLSVECLTEDYKVPVLHSFKNSMVVETDTRDSIQNRFSAVICLKKVVLHVGSIK